MSCNYCQNIKCSHSTHYDIANVKGRFIPTYAHDQIFTEKNNTVPVRCTPTFHSSALDVRGYQPSVNQHLKKTQPAVQAKTVYLNDSKIKRQVDLNPRQQEVCSQPVQWYDPAKEQLFDKLACCTARYSRERKLADLSSNPVFGGVTMLPPDCQKGQTCSTGHFRKGLNACQQVEVCQESGEPQVQAQKLEEVQPESENIDPQAEENEDKPLAETKPQIETKEQKPLKKEVPAIKKKVQTTKKTQTKKSGPSQKYILNQDVSLCTRGCSAGRKIAKSVVLGDKPAYTVFRK